MEDIFNNPSLTIALALAAGITAQTLAHHLRIPAIVVLLVTGVLLGPDLGDIIRPATLGNALGMLTGFAVAIILFEGGMSLKMARLKREQRSIRQLITIGGAVTVMGGALASRFVLGWDWRMSVLFGTLVMVTGPTVINPLLQRLKVKRNVAVVLEAEGVLIDAIGAIVAIVALEAALSPAGKSIFGAMIHVFERLGGGAAMGLVFGLLLVRLFKTRDVVPEGMENVFTLCLVLAVFQVANALLPESGIAAVTVAGIVVGNSSAHIREDLAEFKEELTVMMIAMLFVLLAADVRLAEVRALGWPGFFTVLALMLVVRPANVFAGTFKSKLTIKERLFIAWIGPRGIVAAAVASLFAAEFSKSGLAGGNELRALVFLVITVTVLCAGLTGGLVARLLGLKRPSNFGWVILGANELARTLAKLFKENGQEVVCIDANPEACTAAENDCTRVIFGNALRSSALLRAEIETRRGALAVTPNEEVNLLFIQKVSRLARSVQLFTALKRFSKSVSPKMAASAGADVLFGKPVDVEFWSVRIRRRQISLQYWEMADSQPEKIRPEKSQKEEMTALIKENAGLAVALLRGEKLSPMGARVKYRRGDQVVVLTVAAERERIEASFQENGWRLMKTIEGEAFSTSQCMLEQ